MATGHFNSSLIGDQPQSLINRATELQPKKIRESLEILKKQKQTKEEKF